MEKVAIVGVGLIGGSIGLALRERRLAKEVIGFGRSSSTLEKAKQRGVISSIAASLREVADGADVVVVCTPVELIASQVAEIAAGGSGTPLITDAGSTKASIVSQLDRELDSTARFVGSHPLAGSERCGVDHARADLLQNRVVVVTPTERTAKQDLAEISAFWQLLGARVVQMTPGEHDAALAKTSHLPHLIASALAASTDRSVIPLTAGGWRDSTRIAGGDPQLWQQILHDNRTNVLHSLSNFEAYLQRFRTALEHEDPAELLDLLQEGKITRDALGS